MEARGAAQPVEVPQVATLEEWQREALQQAAWRQADPLQEAWLQEAWRQAAWLQAARRLVARRLVAQQALARYGSNRCTASPASRATPGAWRWSTPPTATSSTGRW
jgi:hypothetical protein